MDIAIAKCICGNGYLSLPNGKCVVQTPPTFLLFSKSKPPSIKGVTLDGQNETIVPIMGLIRAEVIDFDSSTRTILFADTDRIAKATLEGGEISVILNKGIGKCGGIAYDWLTKNLYWTDEDKRSVSVINLANTTQKKTLIQDTTIRPSGIVVSPNDGLLFWAHNSWLKIGNNYIERSWMDGTNRIKLMEFNHSWASGLALDIKNRKLYWSDAVYNYIESSNFDGLERKKILTTNIQHPFGISFHENTLYFAELMKGTILRYDLLNAKLTEIDRGNEPLLQTKIYDSTIQSGNDTCKTYNCPELCLTIPNNRALCACSDGYEYSNGNCVKKQNKIDCPNGSFACQPEGHCIPNKYKCDGVVNCTDYTEEKLEKFVSCNNVTSCNSTQFLCDRDLCIDNDWVCDGLEDCVDGSDEALTRCKDRCDPEHKFKCKTSGRCILKRKVCNNHFDCGGQDKSDEENCSEYQFFVFFFEEVLIFMYVGIKKCEVTEFTCKNKFCVSIDMYCDGINDCGDNSDEVDCVDCGPNEMPCQPKNSCIPLTEYCDGIQNCPDGTDENDCIKVQCNKDQFQCSYSQCVSAVSISFNLKFRYAAF